MNQSLGRCLGKVEADLGRFSFTRILNVAAAEARAAARALTLKNREERENQ
jgi:hypothetical protein